MKDLIQRTKDLIHGETDHDPMALLKEWVATKLKEKSINKPKAESANMSNRCILRQFLLLMRNHFDGVIEISPHGDEYYFPTIERLSGFDLFWPDSAYALSLEEFSSLYLEQPAAEMFSRIKTIAASKSGKDKPVIATRSMHKPFGIEVTLEDICGLSMRMMKVIPIIDNVKLYRFDMLWHIVI